VLELDQVLRFAVDRNASDLHIKVGSPPFVRVDGMLEPAPFESVEADDTDRIARSILPAELTGELDRAHELDFVHSVPGLGRFRVSVFRQLGSIGLAVRYVAPGIPSLDELGLPPVAAELVDAEGGLVLVSGPARSGKTTTLAAMVHQVNRAHRRHIITIEDPIEILHRDEQSIVNQREVGTDTDSYATALKRATRQDPDVIVVGLIDNEETARAVLAAAGSGHLVVAAMSTLTPASSIKTLVEHFPTHLEQHARAMLATALRGVVSQKLLVRSDGGGRVLAAEIVVATSPVTDAITRAQEMIEFPRLVSEGEYWGMQSFDSALLTLFEAGLVSKRDVIANATEPSDIRMALEQVRPASESDTRPTLLSDHRPVQTA
jgi:twitching motility protein PilT